MNSEAAMAPVQPSWEDYKHTEHTSEDHNDTSPPLYPGKSHPTGHTQTYITRRSWSLIGSSCRLQLVKEMNNVFALVRLFAKSYVRLGRGGCN